MTTKRITVYRYRGEWRLDLFRLVAYHRNGAEIHFTPAGEDGSMTASAKFSVPDIMPDEARDDLVRRLFAEASNSLYQALDEEVLH